MGGEFHYPQLDQALGAIRPLALSPDLSAYDNKIQCRLVMATLDASYEALSYAWGTPDDHELKIRVNDFQLPVRKNLYCALTALRSTVERFLWIDAICINQKDSFEKGHQVGMMDSIYERAKQVLVWLGYSDYFLALAIDVGERPTTLGSAAPLEREALLGFDLVNSLVAGSKKPLGFDEWEHFRPYFTKKWIPHWQQLADLYTAPYWRRLWIVQEFGLAEKLQILYGAAMCDGTIFLHFRELLFQLPIWVLSGDRGAAAVPDIGTSMSRILGSQAMFLPVKVRTWIYGNGFKSLLRKCEEQYCAERRDKVYAIYRLPHDIMEGDMQIDYEETIPHLYEKLMMWEIRRGKSSSVDRFSRALQRAPLGPLSPDDSPVEMFDSLPSKPPRVLFTRPNIIYNVSSVLIGQIWTIPLSQPWVDMTLVDIKKPEILLLEHISDQAPLPLRTMDIYQWRSALEMLWEVDYNSIARFESNSSDQNGKGVKLFAFSSTSGLRIGLRPDCLQDADILCRLQDHIAVICRYENNDYHFLGRAAIGPGDVGKRRADVTRDHPLWPPPDYDIYYGLVNGRKLIWTWSVPITMLQSLTSPLRWSKEREGSCVNPAAHIVIFK